MVFVKATLNGNSDYNSELMVHWKFFSVGIKFRCGCRKAFIYSMSFLFFVSCIRSFDEFLKAVLPFLFFFSRILSHAQCCQF